MRIEDNVVRKRIRAGGGAATVTDDRRRLGIGGGDDAQEIHVTRTGVEGKGCRGGGRGGEGRRKEVDKGKEHRRSRFIFHHDGQNRPRYNIRKFCLYKYVYMCGRVRYPMRLNGYDIVEAMRVKHQGENEGNFE